MLALLFSGPAAQVSLSPPRTQRWPGSAGAKPSAPPIHDKSIHSRLYPGGSFISKRKIGQCTNRCTSLAQTVLVELKLRYEHEPNGGLGSDLREGRGWGTALQGCLFFLPAPVLRASGLTPGFMPLEVMVLLLSTTFFWPQRAGRADGDTLRKSPACSASLRRALVNVVATRSASNLRWYVNHCRLLISDSTPSPCHLRDSSLAVAQEVSLKRQKRSSYAHPAPFSAHFGIPFRSRPHLCISRAT